MVPALLLRLVVVCHMLAVMTAPEQALGQQSKSTSGKVKHSCDLNGCGPGGFFGAVVPNNLGACQFKPACDAHDLCYARCTDCHPDSALPMCEGLKNKQDRRAVCDQEFRRVLLSQNATTTICRVASEAYYIAVRALGDRYHRSLRTLEANAAEFRRLLDAELSKGKSP